MEYVHANRCVSEKRKLEGNIVLICGSAFGLVWDLTADQNKFGMSSYQSTSRDDTSFGLVKLAATDLILDTHVLTNLFPAVQILVKQISFLEYII